MLLAAQGALAVVAAAHNVIALLTAAMEEMAAAAAVRVQAVLMLVGMAAMAQ